MLLHILSLPFYQGAHSWQRYTRGREDVLGQPPGSAQRRKAPTHVLLQSFPHCCMMGHWHWKLSNHFENSKQEDNYSAVAACIVNKCVCRCVSVCASAWLLEGVQVVQKWFSVFRILTRLKFTHQFDIYIYVFCCC